MPRCQEVLPPMPMGEKPCKPRKNRGARAGYRKTAAKMFNEFLGLGYRVVRAVCLVDEPKFRQCMEKLGRVKPGGRWEDKDPLTRGEERVVSKKEAELLKTPVKMLMNWSLWRPHVEDLLRSVPRDSEMILGDLWTLWYGPPYVAHPPAGEGPPTAKEWLATPECSDDEDEKSRTAVNSEEGSSEETRASR